MAPFARRTQISRRSWLLAGLSLPLFSLRAQDKLNATFDGDNVRVAAPPNWHFLTGKPLQRLKDGATVVYLAQLGLYEDSAYQRPFRTSLDRFAISYDVWQNEKFSVTVLSAAQRTSPTLSAAATEAWCLENLAISASNLAADRRFWMRLEMRTADKKDLSNMVAGQGMISFAELVRALGRKAGADDPIPTLEAGPLRLADLVRTPGRGPRNG